MGTNYYLEKECECCGHVERVHVGKSSAGWRFLWHAYEDPVDALEQPAILSAHKWWSVINNALMQGWRLVNEYGRVEEVDGLESISRVVGRRHSEEYPDHGFKDEDGNEMLRGEWS